MDDGSCMFSGCMDPESVNYDSNANIEDGNCIDIDKIPAGYTYYWNDEFNKDSLNSRYWNIEIRWPGFVNNEIQSYTDSDANIFLQNGNLYIRALKDNPFDPNQPAYTSGRINTKEKVELQYGFWEIRAKLPRGVGTWPAIWMLNSYIDSLGWPNCGEIDIMEHVGYDPNHVFFSMHNANLYGDIHGTNQQGIYELEGIENDFHTYSVEWDSSFVRAYFDGNLFFNYPKPEIHDINSWPYDNPFFLIINLAIGGEWGGQQGIDNSIFPATFTIDYVRIFKKTDL
tara:strand:- start:2076 stop:2927 length:852 start_codon:yes stop_codon:yes gene_type:complete